MYDPLTASLQAPRLLLVRHGQTAWNQERRFLGRTDIPLDATGRAQAARLAARLSTTPLAAVWSSPLSRARETAAALGAPHLDPDLVELDMGDLEGLPAAEFPARFPTVAQQWRDTPHAITLPGGERLVDVQARGLAALGRIGDHVGPGDTVAVVTHQLLLAAVVCTLSGRPLAEFRSYMHRNTGFTTIELGGVPRVLSVDDAAHLEG
jgi:probable phosphoglycerate mutase